MTRAMHEWVRASARARPDARAIVTESGSLTYGELDALSDGIAHALASRGCRKGDRVAVLGSKTPRTIAGMVGALKAGCGYVPLDPASPIRRNMHLLGRCSPRALLVGDAGWRQTPELEARGDLQDLVLGALDDEGDDGARPDFRIGGPEAGAPAPEVDVGPDDLAYILFTSGSTGTPKGVPVTHRSVCAFIDWVVDYFDLGEGDRMSGHSQLTFDLSVLDVYAAFASGAELHPVPGDVNLLPARTIDFMRERRLTFWFSVPSVLAYVARFDALREGDLPDVRHLVWCGDVLATPHLLYWTQRLPRVAFTNLYGPTETTVASSYYRVSGDFDDESAEIPIGSACPGEELLVLDEAMQPVPSGATGDLYIGGVGLSPGYWEDPERTREAFVPDPRAADGGPRLYRTGDLARVGSDGLFYFCGRSDYQIKVSGYRVGPAEVEAAVASLPEIGACVVVPVPTGDFHGASVGCAFVPVNGERLSPARLKTRLASVLPKYMIPTRWIEVAQLPATSRGKIDRNRVIELLRQGAGG